MTSNSSNQLLNLVQSSKFSLAEGARISRELISQFQSTSKNISQPNFRSLDAGDLQLMFEMIDHLYFGNQIQSHLADGRHQLRFRVSKRMTNSGGITTTKFTRNRSDRLDFEIAISSTLLFESFNDNKPILVTGLLCGDRLHALKRIMEHEMIHLIEMALWRNSSCSARRFQDIAKRLFSHKQSTHELITPADSAKSKFAITAGDWVSFQIKGHQLFGYVNRITKRATVLVPSAQGKKYTDGKSYLKYYVPIENLSKAA